MRLAVARFVVAVLRFVLVHLLVNVILFNLVRVALLMAGFGRYPRATQSRCARRSRFGLRYSGHVLVRCGIALFDHFANAGSGA
jgi:hypothetical protein